MKNKNLKLFNMNSIVAVKLSEDGHRHLEEYFGKNDTLKEYLKNNIQINGDILEIQLVELMQIFGSEIREGSSGGSMFQSMEMLLSGDDLRSVEIAKKIEDHDDHDER